MPRRCRLPALVLLFLISTANTTIAAPAVTVLGGGLTGRPYLLRDDIVLESTDLLETVRDYSDWRSPAWLGWNEHDDSFHWSEVVADGGLVVALNADPGYPPQGFSVSDFTDPAAPREMCIAAGLPAGSAWLRDRALLVGLESAVVAYDLADPAAPLFSAYVPVSLHDGRRWFSAVGERLFLIDHDAALRVLDVHDPRHPVDFGVTSLTGERVDALAGGEGVLYGIMATDSGLDLVTWDVADAVAPLETDRQPLGAGATGRALVRDRELLLAATSDGQVRAFDLATATRPTAGWLLRHDTDRVVVSASAMFFSTAEELYVYGRTAADLTPPEPIRRTPLPRFLTLAGSGPVQVAQLEADPSVLVPVDVSLPAQPRLGKPVATGLGGTLQYADGVGLMREGDDAVRLLDLADPCAPVPRARLILRRPQATAFLAGGGMLVVDRAAIVQPALDLYDIADPDAPVLAATILDRNPMAAGPGWLVCGAGGPSHRDDPRVYKLDGHSPPSQLGQLRTTLSGIYRCRVVGDCVYLFGQDAERAWALEVHQVRDLPTPALIRVMPLGTAPVLVDLYADQLFVQGARDCEVYDVSMPHYPVPAGSFRLPGNAGPGFAVNGNVVTVSGGLITVRSSRYAAAGTPTPAPPAPVRLMTAHPNPFNPGTTIAFTVDHDRDLTLAVYDLRGHLVAQLAQGRFTAGAHEQTWNGADGAGLPSASGVYLVRLHGPGIESVRSITLLK